MAVEAQVQSENNFSVIFDVTSDPREEDWQSDNNSPAMGQRELHKCSVSPKSSLSPKT